VIERAQFQLQLTGGTSENHHFQGYDGYMSLAGFALTLSLVTNYVETGVIRHKGDFPGRNSVRAGVLRPGSVIADFAVLLEAVAVGSGVGGALILSSLVSRVIARNLGQAHNEKDDAAAELVKRKRGDFEALVAAAEPSIRQSHDVIGNGAEKITIVGGMNIINSYDRQTKNYVRSSKKDDEVLSNDVTVTGFYGNSGHGSVFDHELGRNVPFWMPKAVLDVVGNVMSWGLDQYANKTGKKVRISYTRILAMDNREKRYTILDAAPLLN